MYKRCKLTAFVSVIFAILFCSGASAANYSESGNGDLSDNRLAPTVLVLDPGSNTVFGTFGMGFSLLPSGSSQDLDYLTITIPANYHLSGITLLSLAQGGANSFLGVQSGPVMTLQPGVNDDSPLLAWTHV